MTNKKPSPKEAGLDQEDKRKKKGQKKVKNLLPLLLFLLGLAIVAYPLFSRAYYSIEAGKEVDEYIKAVQELDEEEIQERLELAKAYNSVLDTSKLADPYTKEQQEAGVAEYARMLEVHEKIGYVEIPKIDQSLPIYAGTSEQVLQKGVGHLEGTSLPVGGPSTHTVLTAHRGLPEATLFTELDEVEEGDVFYIHVLGKVLAYQVDQIMVVEPSNFEPILVVEDKDYATLLTCTPYMVNSHRLLVRGERIDYIAPIEEDQIGENQADFTYKTYLIIAFIIILLFLMVIGVYLKKVKEAENRIKQDQIPQASDQESGEEDLGSKERKG